MTDKILLVIAGPTASGKTALSIKIAKALQTEIISADSRQFYKELSIGTAKPTEDELAQVIHHLVGHKSITESYSAGDFARDALAKLEELFEKYNIVIMTGGSGLYIDAVCKGFDEIPEIDENIRAWIINMYSSNGIAWLVSELEKKDPAYLAIVDQKNPQRLMRALEVYEATGTPFSEFRKRSEMKRPFRIITIGLEPARAALYQKINQRVDDMISAGLEDEVKAYQDFRDKYALRTVGYSEFFDYFDEKNNLADTIMLIKQHTRNFAKRQLTWFKRNKETIWFDPSDEFQIFESLKKMGIL
jgi:tRNA dimethylallyltransferase